MPIFTDLPQAFVLRNASEALTIDRRSGEIAAVDPEKASLAGAGKPSETIAGVLGIVDLPFSKYLVLAMSSKRAGDIGGEPVYRVTQTRIVAFGEANSKDADYVSLLRSHLDAATLFYSPTHDITSRWQRTSALKGAPHSYDERFFWNLDMSRELVSFPRFLFPVIYGVFSESKLILNGKSVQFGVISRRSRHRAGTRYFRRGLDALGNAANFNETEQFVIVGGRVFSHVQTRGSVPAFWGEVNTLRYRPTLEIGDLDSSAAAAAKHFAGQKEIYGTPQFLVNLVNQTGYEKPVKEIYEQVVESLRDPALQYVYFDFHHECSKMRWHRVQILIDRLIELGLNKTGWFESVNGEAVANQSGVVRTNCMDCLDRTNVVQSCVAMHVLQRQLEAAGVLAPGSKIADNATFTKAFRNIWADNADGVSCAYSGTGALKTDFTRTGKRTKLGALNDLRNSIVRYYTNNLRDGPRQDGFSLFVGEFVPSARSFPFVDRRSLWIQAVPYVLGGSLLVALLSILYPSDTHSTLFNFFMSLLFASFAAASLKFIFGHGLQYVNWPKLIPLDWVRWSSHGYEIVGQSQGSKEE